MIPTPVALSLTLCDQVIVEQGTQKVSLIGSFTGMAVDRFPSEPQRFSVFAALSRGSKNGIIKVVGTSAETSEQIYTQEGTVSFPDRSTVVNVHFRVRRCVFPAPGRYLFTLSVDGESIADRFVRIHLA